MSPHLEAQLEAVFQRRVRMAGGIIFKLAPTLKGMPDRLVILPIGRMYLVELKTKTGRLSPAQVELHRRLRAIGVDVVVLYGVEEIGAWLNERARDYDPVNTRRSRPRKRDHRPAPEPA